MKSRHLHVAVVGLALFGLCASSALGDSELGDKREAFASCVAAFEERHGPKPSHPPAELSEQAKLEELKALYPEPDDPDNVEFERNAQGYLIVAVVPYFMINVSMESPFAVLNMYCLAKRDDQMGWSAKAWAQ